jgi:hypothetical protein
MMIVISIILPLVIAIAANLTRISGFFRWASLSIAGWTAWVLHSTNSASWLALALTVLVLLAALLRQAIKTARRIP